jgi:hypothetical protein
MLLFLVRAGKAAEMNGLSRRRSDRAPDRAAAVQQVTGPDDPVVAGVALAGGTYLVILYVIMFLAWIAWGALLLTGHVNVSAVVPVIIPLGVVSGAAQWLLPVYYLAVTRQQVVGLRVSRFGGQIRGVAFTAPLAAVSARIGRATPLGLGVRITAPGQRELALRAGRLAGLTALVRALQAGGASVTGPGAQEAATVPPR